MRPPPALDVEERLSPLKAFSRRWAVFGALAIFFYVGSEVTIGDLLTNFLHSPNILNIPLVDGGQSWSASTGAGPWSGG